MRPFPSGEPFLVEGLPEGKILSPTWAPNSQTLAFVIQEPDGLHLWKVKAGSRKAERFIPDRINGVLPGNLFRWAYDGESLLTRLVIERSAPKPSDAPKGPTIRVTSGEKSPVRTYQDLLKNEKDAESFEFYATAQLARVKLNNEIVALGEPGLTQFYLGSPDGAYILRRTVNKPYSYLVPYYSFAGTYEILNPEGKLVKTIAQFDAADNLPKGFDSVRQGVRSIEWRDDHPATLAWAEAQDGGDMKTDVEFHDRVYTLSAPFDSEPEVLLDIERRYAGVDWGHEHLALVSDWRFSDRKTRTWKFDPSNPKAEKTLLDDRSYNDKYKDPGDPIHTQGPLGTNILKTLNDGKTLILRGSGASPEGKIPFLDLWNSETGESQRVWHSEAPYYERVFTLMGSDANLILTLRESVDEPPNFFLRNLQEKSVVALTNLPHPTPDFKNIKKELITYKRKDGVDLSAVLYLPADYKEGRLPVVMWAYPLEYKDPKVAGQVDTSPFEFKRVSYWGPLAFLAMGYAVLDDPKMPIIGSGEQLPNDSFRQQLVDSAEAAVEAVVEKGVGDRGRMAIGGHSYGAFMVANLLAHSDLFKTGIARSGAYNRTLTPFGFQGEERDFWEGQEVYAAMSPFFHAEKIKEPILMIHGSEDNNSGTYPMQSERMFSAIKGLGGEARLVMLPKESHGYKARESLLHMLWEQQEWLRKYL